jgi:hypothetical protein
MLAGQPWPVSAGRTVLANLAISVAATGVARFRVRWSRHVADAETTETPADAAGRCRATFSALRLPHPYHG